MIERLQQLPNYLLLVLENRENSAKFSNKGGIGAKSTISDFFVPTCKGSNFNRILKCGKFGKPRFEFFTFLTC